jgi:alpha-L-rhamnosidase
LSQNGRINEAYDLLLKEDYPSWLYQVTKGATTIWEHWDGLKPDGTMWSANMNSFNHYAYGAIGDWLYRVVAGLDIDAERPGYKHIIMKPQPGGGLTYAEAGLTTIYGKAAIKWSIEESDMIVNISIPHNTTASVTLPGAKIEGLNSFGIVFKESSNGAEAEIGSGTYKFVYSYSE